MKLLKCFLICYAIVLVGCNRQSTYERILVEADSLIEQQTDSALNLLNGMTDILEKGDDSSRAYYILLLTQARYKCYQPVLPDSLMRFAVRYYENSGNASMICRSYYYLAMPLYEKGQKEEALLLLKKGETIAAKEHDMCYMAKYHESLCMVNYDSQNHHLMLKYAKLSLDDAENLKDTIKIIRNLSHVSTAYYRLGNYPEAKKYILKSLALIDSIDKETKAYILTNVGILYHTAGNIEYSRLFLEKAVCAKPLPHTFAELGNIYAESGDMGKAEKNWKIALNAGDSQTVIDVLTSMQDYYEQQKNYKLAIEINHKKEALKDSILSVSKQEALAEIQHKYDSQVKENKYYKVLTWLFGCILFFILLTLVLIYAFRWSISKFTNQLSVKEEVIRDAQRKITMLRDMDGEHNEEIAALQDQIVTIQKQTFEQLGRGREIYNKIVEGGKLSSTDKEQYLIEYYAILHYETFASWMRMYKDLSTRLLTFLILQDMGKSNAEIEQILSVTNSSLRSIKTRLKAKKKLRQ